VIGCEEMSIVFLDPCKTLEEISMKGFVGGKQSVDAVDVSNDQIIWRLEEMLSDCPSRRVSVLGQAL